MLYSLYIILKLWDLFRNFFSFKDEVMQSIEVAKDTALKDTPTWGGYTERFAMVMGANASGKSNLLKALDYMWMFVRPH